MRKIVLIVSAALVVAILGGVIGASIVLLKTPRNPEPGYALEVQNQGPVQLDVGVNANSPVIEAVRKVGPAVVNINTLSVQRRSILPFSGFFRDFFNDNFFTEPVPRKGQGSGLIIDNQNGYVLTNEHVISDVRRNGGEITVSLPDKRTFDGKLVGADASSDLAVVKIQANDLPKAGILNTYEPTIGQWAIAIGNPFGFRNTVTVGVVSATSRTLSTPNEGQLEDLIQTDAAINPGNSGGPLCDVEGRVIGLNTAIIPYGQGIGFAISARTMESVAQELIKYGRVRRGWSGLYFWDISARLARQLGLPSSEGALVAEVIQNSPGDVSGVKPGDVVILANGNDIKSVQDMQYVMQKSRPDQQLELTIWRDGNKEKKTLKLVEAPERLRR